MVQNKELEHVIDIMYDSWLDYAGNKDKQNHHPSREVYGQIIKHAQLWNKAVKELNGGADDRS